MLRKKINMVAIIARQKAVGPKRNDCACADKLQLSDWGILSRPMGRHHWHEKIRGLVKLQRYRLRFAIPVFLAE
jgi:hypothetical protein